jgi:hypothetical protein
VGGDASSTLKLSRVINALFMMSGYLDLYFSVFLRFLPNKTGTDAYSGALSSFAGFYVCVVVHSQ